MHLTPEQKQIGKDNFDEVVGETRRDFLKKGLAAGVVSGAGLGAMYYGYGAEVKEPVRVGVIGTGDEGSVLIGAVTPEFIQVVAIADIRTYNIHRAFHGDYYSDGALAARPGLMAKYGWKTEDEARQHVQVYTDQYDELLDDPNVEGVIIALPLHLHDEAAIKAMRKGKHVLTEKLMAHSVHQCKQMARVAAETNRLLATGHQRHYNILYDNAVHTIRRGILGDLHYVRAQWHRGNLPGNDSWKPDLPPPPGTDRASKEAAKAYPLIKKLQSWDRKLKDVTKKRQATEIDLWQKRLTQLNKQIDDLVKAEDYGYQEMTLQDGKGSRRTALGELVRWRLWNRTGGGLMAELGSHQLDAAGIFITADSGGDRKVLPLTVQAVGGRYVFPPDREVADHVYCMLEYPGKGYYGDDQATEIADPNKKIVVTYSSINGNGFGGYGETVYGTAGTLILDREQEAMLYRGSSTASRVTVTQSSSGPTLDTTESGAPGAAAALARAGTGPISRGYTEEIEHWAWCIRNPDSDNKPRCGPKVALADAVIALTTNIAMHENRRIEFKPEWFDIQSDETPEGIKPGAV